MAQSDLTNESFAVDVWFDYACPFAWAGQMWLDQVKAELGEKLTVNWRIFPLEQVNRKSPDFDVWRDGDPQGSTLRSFKGFHAAQQQGEEAFSAFHAALFRKRHIDGRNLAGQAVLESAAEEAGLDLDRFRADLESDAVLATIERDYTRGQGDLEVFGTPTIVFDNEQGAYLKLNYKAMPEDPVEFWYDFVRTVRDRPSVIEIKRPAPMGK